MKLAIKKAKAIRKPKLPLKPNALLDYFTMYRVVLYGLILICVVALVEAGTGLLSFTPVDLAASLVVSITVSAAVHFSLRKVFNVSAARESWLITALLMFLILRPNHTLAGLTVIAIGALLAMVSKYVLTFHDHHIFNPVAFSLVTLGLLGSNELFWWVGSLSLLPVVAIVGAAVVYKTRKLRMTLLFIFISIGVSFIFNYKLLPLEVLKQVVLSGPLIYFACIMFSEPLTSPTTRRLRYIFAVIVGVMYGASFHIGPLHSGPEFALLIGNVFSFAVSHPQRLRLEFMRQKAKGLHVYEFTFRTSRKPQFKPGQYMELTLPHKGVDNRGNRRFLSIVSSPSEPDLRLAIRLDPDHNSSFKRALMGLRPGAMASASAIGGDFVLPKSTMQKVLLIAGGIGITPFASMIQDVIDTKISRDITVVYSEKSASGFSYNEVLDEASQYGVNVIYVISGDNIPEGWTGLTGPLTATLLETAIKGEPRNIIAYISGPPVLVQSAKRSLKAIGVSRRRIRTDLFTGY